MSQKKQVTFEECMENVKTYIKRPENIELIQKAYDFAYEHHKGQFRKSGEPYVIHVIQVANTLAEMHCGPKTIAAGLLHDTVEDCEGVTTETITELFGEEIATLVDAVTKIGAIKFKDEEEYLASNHRKLFIAMAKDIRVILIKLADRLHNMRTLQYMRPEKQKKIARETLSVYAPIAHRLGISEIKNELEDLSFKYLDYKKYEEIKDLVKQRESDRNEQVQEMISDIEAILKEYNIQYRIFGRSKHFYSIYKKMVTKNKRFEEILDLLAIRIITDSVVHCYEILGYIHAKYRPIPGRFKDYIAMPKANMYQSLHTTVFGLDGYLFEIQIRTYDMDEVAENGIASHWAYKENKDAKANMQSTTEQKLQFFKAIMDLNNDKMSSEDFVHSVKDEVLNNNIYVFTPKGDVIELPKGATPIDFAYKVHTKVGETTVGAIVNNSIVPLNYELKNNDIVKINTNKNSTPSKEWLNIVKATQTKNKIKSYFSKNEREIYIERGKYALEKELRKRKLSFSEFFNDENTKKIMDTLKVSNIDEVYLCVGNNKTSANTVVNIIDKYKEVIPPKVVKMAPKTNFDSDTDLIVSGIDKVRVNLANCCNPVFGDDIIGYITRGNGISVHRSNCHNISMLDDRMVNVKWNELSNKEKRYLTSLVIYTDDLDNRMADIVSKTSMMNINIDGIRTIGKEKGIIYAIDVYVRDLEQLDKLLMEYNKLTYIIKVERLMK